MNLSTTIHETIINVIRVELMVWIMFIDKCLYIWTRVKREKKRDETNWRFATITITLVLRYRIVVVENRIMMTGRLACSVYIWNVFCVVCCMFYVLCVGMCICIDKNYGVTTGEGEREEEEEANVFLFSPPYFFLPFEKRKEETQRRVRRKPDYEQIFLYRWRGKTLIERESKQNTVGEIERQRERESKVNVIVSQLRLSMDILSTIEKIDWCLQRYIFLLIFKFIGFSVNSTWFQVKEAGKRIYQEMTWWSEHPYVQTNSVLCKFSMTWSSFTNDLIRMTRKENESSVKLSRSVSRSNIVRQLTSTTNKLGHMKTGVCSIAFFVHTINERVRKALETVCSLIAYSYFRFLCSVKIQWIVKSSVAWRWGPK